MKKRFLSILLTALLLCAVPLVLVDTAYAASGSCGDKLTWSLSDDGTLTISGKGAMDNYKFDGYDYLANSYRTDAPWDAYRYYRDSRSYYIRSVVIENGVTSIGDRAFYGCVNLSSVTISSSVTSIGEYAFYDCRLASVTIPSRVTSIGSNAFDSTSRWAEALREMSGRLEEMPGEEGYPAYLASRLAQFYERAGVVQCLASDERTGSLTAVGAVSPPGGDLSEPVAQATMRIVKVFWSLDASLAYRRHFPAINWLNSYSLYLDAVTPWFNENMGEDFIRNRNRAMHLLQEENELNEIVQLVGKDSLSANDQLTLEIARMLREDFLQQNAFMDVDSYSSFDRQMQLLGLILHYESLCRGAVDKAVAPSALYAIPAREKLGWAKYAAAEEYAANYAAVRADMEREIAELIRKAGEEE